MNTITINIILGLIILSVFSMIFFLIYKVYAYGEKIEEVESENKTLNDKLNGNSGDRSFRLSLKTPVECSYFIDKIDGEKIDINKEGRGSIVNISRTGLLMKTNFNFPIEKKNLSLKFNFKIDKVNFTLSGRLLRKEVRSKSDDMYYGVEFEEVPSSITRNLSIAINRMDVAQRREKLKSTAI